MIILYKNQDVNDVKHVDFYWSKNSGKKDFEGPVGVLGGCYRKQSIYFFIKFLLSSISITIFSCPKINPLWPGKSVVGVLKHANTLC